MKFFESHFDEYLSAYRTHDLHPTKPKAVYAHMPDTIDTFQNVIFYGPPGVGKYTQALSAISKYSVSGLRYEKKCQIVHNKHAFHFKISDIHYEIDMSLLGCQSKSLWHELYRHIYDIIATKPQRHGIILCTEFQHIHSELLDIFHTYMQNSQWGKCATIHFVIVTTDICFFPQNVLNHCQIISIPTPAKIHAQRCGMPLPNSTPAPHVNNMKHIKANSIVLNEPHKHICDNIICMIVGNINNVSYSKLRELLYSLLTYNLNIYTCIWYIVSVLINRKHITNANLCELYVEMFRFFQYFNNNYRPIYHLESFAMYLIKTVHKL